MQLKLNVYLKELGKIRFPVATLLIAVAIVVVYAILAKFELFIAASTFNKFAFSIFMNPANFINYIFVHTGPVHLVSDIVFLVFFGLIAEQELNRRDILIVFLVCGIVGGIVFTYFMPTYLLVGSSAGVYGLLGAAVAVRPKEAIIIAILVTILVPYLVVPIVHSTELSVKDAIRQESILKTKTLQATKTQLSDSQQLYQNLSTQLSDFVAIQKSLLAQGKDTSFIDKKIAEIQAQLDKLDEAAKAMQADYEKQRTALISTQKREMVYSEGLIREGTAPVALLSHISAMLCGALYIVVFRKEKFSKIFTK